MPTITIRRGTTWVSQALANGEFGLDLTNNILKIGTTAGTAWNTALTLATIPGNNTFAGDNTFSSTLTTSAIVASGGLRVFGGSLTDSGVYFRSPTSSAPAVFIEAKTSQSADLLRIFGASPTYTPFVKVNNIGNLTASKDLTVLGTTTLSNVTNITGGVNITSADLTISSGLYSTGAAVFNGIADFGGVINHYSTYLGGARTSSSPTIIEEGVAINNSSGGYWLSVNRDSSTPLFINRITGTTAAAVIQFYRNGTAAGTINASTSTSPVFVAPSDYRIKREVTPITNALTRFKKAKAYTFYKTTDPSKTIVEGFLAHELAEVQPDAVIGEKDAVDDNGEMILQEVMEARLIPVMAQAIHDLVDLVESLQLRVDALEGK